MVYEEKYLKAQKTENKTYYLSLHNGHMATNKQTVELIFKKEGRRNSHTFGQQWQYNRHNRNTELN